MNNLLNANKFAIAAGTTSVIFYLGCVISMKIAGRELIVKLANILFHGMDFTNVIRMDIPAWEIFCGLFASFIIWGFLGFVLASIYNRMK